MSPTLLLIAILCTAQDAPQSAILKTLPSVATVEAKPIEKPTSYLIHILDWHFVSQEAFLADLRDQGITEDLEAKYAKHLDDVETVQNEQKALLRALVEQHGVTEMYVEGVTEQRMPTYERQLAKVQSLGRKLTLLQEIAGKIDDEDLRAKVKVAEKTLRSELLRIGGAGQLHMDGVLKTLPANSEAEFEAARPVSEAGKVRLDAKLIEARESAIVKNVLAGGPVSVLVLGGAHDLSDNVPEGCQYIRVGTTAYQKMAQER